MTVRVGVAVKVGLAEAALVGADVGVGVSTTGKVGEGLTIPSPRIKPTKSSEGFCAGVGCDSNIDIESSSK